MLRCTCVLSPKMVLSALFLRVDETEEALKLAPVAHHQYTSKARHIRQVWSILIEGICKRCMVFLFKAHGFFSVYINSN